LNTKQESYPLDRHVVDNVENPVGQDDGSRSTLRGLWRQQSVLSGNIVGH